MGSSIAVVIPRRFVQARNIELGDIIDLEPVRVLTSRHKRYKLLELMAHFKPLHRHGEWELGEPVGKELW